MAIIWYNGWNMGVQAGEFDTETAAIGLGFPYPARWDATDESVVGTLTPLTIPNPCWIYFNYAFQIYLPGERVEILQLKTGVNAHYQFSLYQSLAGDFEARLEDVNGAALMTLSIPGSNALVSGAQFLFVLYIYRDDGAQAAYQLDMYGKSPIQEYPAAGLDSMVARASATGPRQTTAQNTLVLRTEKNTAKPAADKMDWSCSDVVVASAPLQAPGGLVGGWASGGPSHIGPRVLTVLPTGNVTSNWQTATGGEGSGTFAEWDDVSPPLTTDYNQDNALNEVQVSSCQDASAILDVTPWDWAAGPTAGIKDVHKVIAVGLRPRHQQGAASPAKFKPRYQITGQTPVDGAEITPTAAWRSYDSFMFTESPPTVGGDWEHDKINDLEVGAIISTAGTGTVRIDSLSVTALCDVWRQWPPGVF